MGFVRQHLAGINGLAAADGEDHIRVRHLRPKHIHILTGSLAAVPEGAGDLDAGPSTALRIRLSAAASAFLPPMMAAFFAVGRADVHYVVVGVRAYGISGEKSFLHDKHLKLNFDWICGKISRQ